MKIMFIGAVEFSRRALNQLIDMQADIVGVCTLRNSTFNADHCDLSSVCEEEGIPWIDAPNINADESIQWIADKRPDVMFCFGWSRLLRGALLHLAPLGVIGFHPTALPANRGRHPLIWALALGLQKTASTFFFMDEDADHGDILSQKSITITDADDATMLYEKVTLCALDQIKAFVPQLASGLFPRVVQDDERANEWRKRCEADGQIDWRMSARSIANLIRALAKPYVGAHFLYKGQKYKIWNAEIILDIPENIEPGKVIEVMREGSVVKCGEQGVRLLRTEPIFRPDSGEYL